MLLLSNELNVELSSSFEYTIHRPAPDKLSAVAPELLIKFPEAERIIFSSLPAVSVPDETVILTPKISMDPFAVIALVVTFPDEAVNE